jgi:hypothetical protein
LASTDALAEIGSAASSTATGMTDNRRRRSMPEATAESLAACEGREGMTIQADLASMTAEPDIFAHFEAKLRALADLRLGVDMASGPDRTVVAKVEIVDGAAKVIEPTVVLPSLAEALGRGNS